MSRPTTASSSTGRSGRDHYVRPTGIPPFVSRDVFRLLVRLEAQKSHEVDTTLLERRFRVPPGYADDENDRKRLEEQRQSETPGPGSYDVPIQAAGSSSLASVFVSTTKRDPFQLQALKKQPSSSLLRADAREYLTPPPPLGSFTRTNRGLTPQNDQDTENEHQPSSPSLLEMPRRRLETNSLPRAARLTQDEPEELGPGAYDVRRLWEPSVTSGRATQTAPTPAVFSASHAKRELMWSPARTPPTNALPMAWNSSTHYAKHKHRVVATLQQRKLKSSQSMPHLPRSGTSSTADNQSSTLDPFEWLRRRPCGEVRANALALKHGLKDHIRPVTPSCGEPGPCEAVSEVLTTDVELPIESVAPTKDTRAPLLTVYVRLPGGCLVSVRLRSSKRIRHLKTAITRATSTNSSTRWTHETAFDLYLRNGTRLAQLERTLDESGVVDRSLVQLVPATG